MIVLDNNEEKINVRIYINENELFNEVNCDFFLPFMGKSSLLIGGLGDYVKIISLNNRIFNKNIIDYSDTILNSDRNNCQCCSIF